MNSSITFSEQKTVQGFTLVEVLVAVAIMAFTVPALMTLMMQHADSAGALRDKTIAYWIAENKATELRIKRTYLQQLLQRESTERVAMAGTEWVVDIDIDNTLEFLVLYRITVKRDPDAEAPLSMLELYLNRI